MIATGLGLLRVWPPFAVVMSGSMAPTINTGDMVVLMRLRSPARVGEVVAVPVPDDARSRYGYPPVVIHRVYRITDGQIRTKGDARPAADPFTVPRTAVDAKVVADVPAGGRILSFFHSGPGLVWLLFGAGLFFGLPLLDRLRDARGQEAEATADLRDQLAAVSVGLAHLQAEQARSRQTADEALSQIDRLARLVADALAQEPSAAADTTRAADSPSATVPEQRASGPEASAAPALGWSRSVGAAPESCATADSPGVASLLGSVAPTPDRTGTQEAAPETEFAVAVEPGRNDAHAATVQPLETTPAVPEEPECEVETEPVAQPLRAAGSAVAEAGGATVDASLSGSGSGSGQPAGAVAAARTLARSSGEMPRLELPGGVGPIAASSLRALERWDALPAASGRDAEGWAAPPAPMRSSRFQRPGRLIPASLAQPSPAP